MKGAETWLSGCSRTSFCRLLQRVRLCRELHMRRTVVARVSRASGTAGEGVCADDLARFVIH
jgi:hypothetical protein